MLRSAESASRSLDFLSSETTLEVVVHDSGRLKECVESGRTDIGPAALFQVSTQCTRRFVFGELEHRLRVDASRPFGRRRLEAPDVASEAAGFFTKFEVSSCVVDGGLDLAPVAYDSRIGDQAFDAPAIEARDFLGIEFSKRSAEVFSFPENREPAEPGLETLEAHLLEKPRVIDERSTPLLIVVLLVEGVVSAPPAASHPAGIAKAGPICHESSFSEFWN